MPQTTIDRLIINSPYEEPQRHWRYECEIRAFDLVEGRRPAGYVVASGAGAGRWPGSRAFYHSVQEGQPACRSFFARGFC